MFITIIFISDEILPPPSPAPPILTIYKAFTESYSTTSIDDLSILQQVSSCINSNVLSHGDYIIPADYEQPIFMWKFEENVDPSDHHDSLLWYQFIRVPSKIYFKTFCVCCLDEQLRPRYAWSSGDSNSSSCKLSGGQRFGESDVYDGVTWQEKLRRGLFNSLLRVGAMSVIHILFPTHIFVAYCKNP
ncbi:hypothetical protein Bca101_032901 [Brassica carinata]